MNTPERVRLANRILAVLETIYDDRTRFAESARERGISLHQLAAAAIAETIAEAATGEMRIAYSAAEKELQEQYERIRGSMTLLGEKVLRLF